eukprot:scpid59855/ scgid24827/ 
MDEYLEHMVQDKKVDQYDLKTLLFEKGVSSWLFNKVLTARNAFQSDSIYKSVYKSDLSKTFSLSMREINKGSLTKEPLLEHLSSLQTDTEGVKGDIDIPALPLGYEAEILEFGAKAPKIPIVPKWKNRKLVEGYFHLYYNLHGPRMRGGNRAAFWKALDVTLEDYESVRSMLRAKTGSFHGKEILAYTNIGMFAECINVGSETLPNLKLQKSFFNYGLRSGHSEYEEKEFILKQAKAPYGEAEEKVFQFLIEKQKRTSKKKKSRGKVFLKTRKAKKLVLAIAKSKKYGSMSKDIEYYLSRFDTKEFELIAVDQFNMFLLNEFEDEDDDSSNDESTNNDENSYSFS